MRVSVNLASLFIVEIVKNRCVRINYILSNGIKIALTAFRVESLDVDSQESTTYNENTDLLHRFVLIKYN